MRFIKFITLSLTILAAAASATSEAQSIYVLGNLGVSGGGWNSAVGAELKQEGAEYVGVVYFKPYGNDAVSYFSIASKIGNDWDVVNSGDRFGPTTDGTRVSAGGTFDLTAYSGNNAGSCPAWTIADGVYKLRVNLATNKLTISAYPTVDDACGWPANYEGVMLQSFYWDCFNDGVGWNWLTARAGEIGKYFDIMWTPNFANCDAYGAGGMGYHPINWFTNFNSAFGTESEFNAMRTAYQQNGVGLIAEVVINHRFSFPLEYWNGQWWQIGNDGICGNDENHGGGANDTGDNWDLAPDLDHTNANVQANIKAYEEMLRNDLGFIGFRYDYVRGYAPEFIKIYNRHSQPRFSVGELWGDGGYDEIANWIRGTEYESAAFDFPGKFAISDAFRDGDMTKLVWNANGTPQPCGVIHKELQRYAVTFIDNHDSYNESYNRFAGRNDQIPAANAFILCSPGTPCLFIVHWNQYKDQLIPLIHARKIAGVNNMSAVTVLRSNRNCYMAEVTGTKGKLVVKIGPEVVSPDGYADSDIVASGTDYCVWIKKAKLSQLHIIGNLAASQGQWDPNNCVAMSADGSKFTATDIEFTKPDDDDYAYFSFCAQPGENWGVVNSADRFGPSTDGTEAVVGSHDVTHYHAEVNSADCKAWKIAPGNYDLAVDLDNYTMTVKRHGEEEPVDMPDALYIIGNIEGHGWSTNDTPALVKDGNSYVSSSPVKFAWVSDDKRTNVAYFSFITALGNDWNVVNASDRIGPETTEDKMIKAGEPTDFVVYPGGENSGTKAWVLERGDNWEKGYDINLNFATNKLTVSRHDDTTMVIEPEIDVDETVRYYNLMGVPVANPANGLYIMVKGGRAYKVRK